MFRLSLIAMLHAMMARDEDGAAYDAFAADSDMRHIILAFIIIAASRC